MPLVLKDLTNLGENPVILDGNLIVLNLGHGTSEYGAASLGEVLVY